MPPLDGSLLHLVFEDFLKINRENSILIKILQEWVLYMKTYVYTVIPRLRVNLLTNFSANEDFFAIFLDSANEYGFR